MSHTLGRHTYRNVIFKGGDSALNDYLQRLNDEVQRAFNPVRSALDGGTGWDAYTLGDLLYADSATTLAKLAGNTTTTKKFLTQTGNGAVSAAPSWGVVTSADLPGARGTATLNFGAFPGASDTSIAVTGQAGIVSGSTVAAWLSPLATADHSFDEHLVEPLFVLAGNIVAGTGFTIYGTYQGLADSLPYGAWNVAWEWF